ncbi:MAG TPA: SDR family oxidoreductase [Solirubrobacterales bacterium]|nr:SDR family oxidoreductase [Solirubrobacterales bacterium]
MRLASPFRAASRLPDPSPDFTALVTGASSGIGMEFARALGRRGHSLTLVARRQERLLALAAEISGEHGVHVDCLAADLSVAAERDGLHAQVLARGRGVQMLVNCAGFGIYEPFAASERERELEQVRLLVDAVVDLDARYLPAMVERGRGAVINIASTAGFQPLPGNGTYSASKAFVLAHTEALAEELRGRGVVVTAVCPGPVPTEFFEVGQPLVVHRIPRLFWCDSTRVAEDGLRAAARGAPSIVPGSVLTRLFYAPYRTAPRPIAAPIARWLMAGELARSGERNEPAPASSEHPREAVEAKVP